MMLNTNNRRFRILAAIISAVLAVGFILTYLIQAI
jgi:hypothetical protein